MSVCQDLFLSGTGGINNEAVNSELYVLLCAQVTVHFKVQICIEKYPLIKILKAIFSCDEQYCAIIVIEY